MNVVIVESSSTVRLQLQALLASEPRLHVVGEAADEPSAIQVIARTQPDVVLMDLALQPGSGLRVLRAVRQLGIDPDDMVSVGVNCSLQQLLEHGFFHADPHPGNLLAIADGARRNLRAGGLLLLEHGATQASRLAAELVARGYARVVCHRDLAGLPRITEATWPGTPSPSPG